MPYCPKCGVEVDEIIQQCPLCQFPIPNIHAYDDVTLNEGEKPIELLKKYPQAYNIYQDYRLKVKNQIFLAVVIVFISAIVIMSLIKFFYPVSAPVLRVVLILTISAVFLIFFSFGYLRTVLNITGIFATFMYLFFSLAKISGGEWFLRYALPLNILAYINVLLIYYIYKKTQRKKRKKFFPLYSLMMVAILALEVEGVITLDFSNGFSVSWSWSFIVAVGCVFLALILEIVTKRMTENMKEVLRRRFHI